MWGFGGRYYWGRKEKGKIEGIVVCFAWMSSEDKHLKKHADLYASLGWNSLIYHFQFLNMFFPDKAASLALQIVDELVRELKLRPCPVVFASFSGGPKACLYKVLQIIEGNCNQEQINVDDSRLIRNCVSGHIFDSTPVDFVSDLGTNFVLHPSVLKMSHPPRLATWIAKGISSSLDALFLSRFESDRAEYWRTLYSTVSMGAPYLILCSEDDDLAPFQTIFNFATRLKDLGADVNMVKWATSSHVGHFRNYPEEYRAAVTELLSKAAIIYSHRIRQLQGKKVRREGPNDQIPDPFGDLRKAESSRAFLRSEVNSTGRFFVPISLEYLDGRVVGPTHDEHAWGRRNSDFNPIIKCIRRSRL